MKAYTYADFHDKELKESEVPAELKEKAEKYRAELVEKAVECDEKTMEKYLGGIEVSNEELKIAIRKGVIANQLYPVFCGTALQNIGVQPVLDGVVAYLPSPLDVKKIEATDVSDLEKKISVRLHSKPMFYGLFYL